MFNKIHWTPQKIARRLALIAPLVYRRKQLLPEFKYYRQEGPTSPPQAEPDVDDTAWDKVSWGSYWGEWYSSFTLRTRFSVPEDWSTDQPVALFLPIGEAGDFSHPEASVYLDGEFYAACDRHHQEIILPEHLLTGEHLLALNGWVGLYEGDRMKKLLMRPCQIVQIDTNSRNFLALARVAYESAIAMDENAVARNHLLNALNDAVNELDLQEPFGEPFYSSVSSALAALKAGIEVAGPAMAVDITAAGHAHIDVAWLWTYDMTRKKSTRTFSNVLRLMEQYPAFQFTQSQPALYEWVRQDNAELFSAIKQRIDEGRWEPIGGMWVEADCNLTGAESLARQFLLGVGFYKQQFGEHAASPVLWLPDVFGYNWNLPQLITEAGLNYFFTIKIGWNQYNRLPYDSFWWQGLDGTRVLTHFSTTNDSMQYASTYNAMATPAQALSTWLNFQQKDNARAGTTPPLLMSYGFGDGGGGPTREMIENISILSDFPGLPQLKFGKAGDFFRKLEESVGDRLPVWNGELYLEYHRGTYTTQAQTKRANRKVEFLLHDTELICAMADTFVNEYAYPQPELLELWRKVCTNQFHDVLPGSSVGPVYTDALSIYGQVNQDAVRIRDAALEALASYAGGDVLIINPTGFWRSDLIYWPRERTGENSGELKLVGNSTLQTQAVEGGLLIDAGELPPFSIKVIKVQPADRALEGDLAGSQRFSPAAADPSGSVMASPNELENDFLRVELNPAGDITRIFDKRNQREVLPAGAVANQYQAFEDRPMDFDAWDIDIYYEQKMWLAEPAESVRVVENGPLRATIEIRRRVLNSLSVQRISLSYNSPRLDFDTQIDWCERHVLLKVAFPVDVLSHRATYEIQWGNVERPTHRNTSWDWARFETVGHKWVDLSEGNYGVSLLNDCKYGHDIRDQVIRLTLLRSPTMPDPDADQGQHQFTYSLFPHSGTWDERTVGEAYALNDPVMVWENTPADSNHIVGKQISSPPASFLSVDRQNIVIETVKGAEDGRGIIVRLYECRRERGEFTLSTAFPIMEAWDDSLIEQDRTRLNPVGNTLTLPFRPYQIMTIRLVPE